MQETVQEYTKRLLSYGEGSDPFRLPQAAPRQLGSWLAGTTGRQLMRRPAAATSSVAGVVADLSDAELALSGRSRQVLSKNAAPIQAYDQDGWAKTFDY